MTLLSSTAPFSLGSGFCRSTGPQKHDGSKYGCSQAGMWGSRSQAAPALTCLCLSLEIHRANRSEKPLCGIPGLQDNTRARLGRWVGDAAAPSPPNTLFQHPGCWCCTWMLHLREGEGPRAVNIPPSSSFTSALKPCESYIRGASVLKFVN